MLNHGGLRSEIRRVTDSELEGDPVKRKILETKTCYYRYAEIPSYNDLEDIFYFFCKTYFPKKEIAESSGRYKHIYVKEIEKDHIIDRWDAV